MRIVSAANAEDRLQEPHALLSAPVEDLSGKTPLEASLTEEGRLLIEKWIFREWSGQRRAYKRHFQKITTKRGASP